MSGKRKAKVTRTTTETQIWAEVNLDGSGNYKITTGIGFLDHMLEQLYKHSLIDIELEAKGDLNERLVIRLITRNIGRYQRENV